MPLVDLFIPIDNVILYLFITAIFEALAVYLFRFRKTSGALLLVFCQICKGIWILAKVFCSLSPDLPNKLFWAKFTEWMPILLIYFWFEFILEVSQQKGRILTGIQYIVRGSVLSLLLIIGFDNWLGWYWGAISLDGQALTIGFGPAAYITMIFCYTLNLVCLALSARWIYCTNGLRRQQAIILSVTPLFNFIGSILGYTLEIQTVSPQVLGLLLSGFYVTWVFYRWRIYSILPLAQDSVTRTMNDGLMIIDKKGYIVGMNPAVKAIFKDLPVDIDNKFEAAVAAWSVLAQIDSKHSLEVFEAVGANGRGIYQIQTLPLTTPQGNLLGKTILFKDITEQKRDEAKIIDQEKALSIMTERERLGRELHDGNGQLWSYINMQIEAARSLIEKKDLSKADVLLEKLADVTQDMHVDIRESITGLQLTAAQEGIWQMLKEYLQWFEENYGIRVQLKLDRELAAGLLSQTTEVQLLRIVQEAMTNVRKSAAACHVRVAVRVNGGVVNVLVEDDGCGFDLTEATFKKGSFGLQIMKERASEIGAQFHIESKRGIGTKITLQVPLASDHSKQELTDNRGEELKI